MSDNVIPKGFSTLYRALIVGLMATAVACSHSSDQRPGRPDDAAAYSSTLHRTDGGIPHIVANDWASLGYGTGYAAAEDHYCELAKNFLKFRAQLSEHFGVADGNLKSDIFFRLQIVTGLYDEEIDPEFDALFEGYAAGFNRYTRDEGANVADPACARAQWIPVVTAEDIRRIHLIPAFLPNVGDLIADGVPPATVASEQPVGAAKSSRNPARQFAALTPSPLNISQEEQLQLDGFIHDIGNPYDHGSNGVAIGRELSVDDHGLLFTNPHLEWDSFAFRMYGFHQIIPGVSNMLGANQAQRANVGFGTNGDVAWTNTVSASVFFSFFRLELVPGDPLRYIFDGKEMEMEAIPITIKVKDENGTVSDYRHTGYRSHIGWMVGGPLAWTEEKADSVRSADEGARGFQGGALAMARAINVRELKAVIDQYANFPSTNVIAADSSGEVLYGDLAPTANFTDEQLVDCNLFGPIYSGNSSACQWQTDEDSAAPGLLGASKQPFLYRFDYVTNSNDSYWLANPEQPLTNAPAVKGPTGTERTMRTRSGLMMVQQRQAGTDGLPGNTFELDSLIDRMLSNQATAAQLLLDGLISLCLDNTVVELEGKTVNISEACQVLAEWDRTYNLESRGAHLFREFLSSARTASDGRGAVPGALNVLLPFDPENPVATPAGLDSETNPAALQALAGAVELLGDADIALDTPLGELQSVALNGERIPLHGGDEYEGVFNKMGLQFDGKTGYPAVTGSSASWVMATHVAGDNTRVKGLASYSESTDPTSENYSNLTRRFSQKDMPVIPFLLADVEAAALSTITLNEGGADCAGQGWENFSGLGVTDEESCREYFNNVYENRLTDYVDD